MVAEMVHTMAILMFLFAKLWFRGDHSGNKVAIGRGKSGRLPGIKSVPPRYRRDGVCNSEFTLS